MIFYQHYFLFSLAQVYGDILGPPEKKSIVQYPVEIYDGNKYNKKYISLEPDKSVTLSIQNFLSENDIYDPGMAFNLIERLQCKLYGDYNLKFVIHFGPISGDVGAICDGGMLMFCRDSLHITDNLECRQKLLLLTELTYDYASSIYKRRDKETSEFYYNYAASIVANPKKLFLVEVSKVPCGLGNILKAFITSLSIHPNTMIYQQEDHMLGNFTDIFEPDQIVLDLNSSITVRNEGDGSLYPTHSASSSGSSGGDGWKKKYQHRESTNDGAGGSDMGAFLNTSEDLNDESRSDSNLLVDEVTQQAMPQIATNEKSRLLDSNLSYEYIGVAYSFLVLKSEEIYYGPQLSRGKSATPKPINSDGIWNGGDHEGYGSTFAPIPKPVVGELMLNQNLTNYFSNQVSADFQFSDSYVPHPVVDRINLGINRLRINTQLIQRANDLIVQLEYPSLGVTVRSWNGPHERSDHGQSTIDDLGTEPRYHTNSSPSSPPRRRPHPYNESAFRSAISSLVRTHRIRSVYVGVDDPCILPAYVQYVHRTFPDVTVVTVHGVDDVTEFRDMSCAPETIAPPTCGAGCAKEGSGGEGKWGGGRSPAMTDAVPSRNDVTAAGEGGGERRNRRRASAGVLSDLQQSMVDMLVLSRTQVLLGDRKSTFLEVSYWLGGRSQPVYHPEQL